MAEILFCHAPEDHDAAHIAAQRLGAHGLVIRMAEGVAERDKQLVDSLPLTLVYWTKRAAASDYVKDVAEHASKILRLIPITPDKTAQVDTWLLRAIVELTDSSDNAFMSAAKIIGTEFRYSNSASLTFTQRLSFLSSRRGQQPMEGKPGSFLFWRDLEPLSPEAHGNLGLGQTDTPFAMLAHTHLVPVTVGEFDIAARFYPIVFDTETMAPSAVMGIRPETNLFLRADGTGDPEADYVPAFVRRYPFLPVAGKDGDVVMCIDRSARVITDKPGRIPFFENGKPSALTNEVVATCQRFDAQMQTTKSFSKLMEELGLFDTASLIVAGDTPSKVGDYLRISSTRLEGLPEKTYLELRDNGALRAAHAHLTSMSNWTKLLERAKVLEAQLAN